MKTKIFTLLMFLCLAYASCKKDDTNATVTLTSKTWKRALVDKNTSTNPVTNPSGNVLYYAVQDFEKDDTFKFGEDGKLTIDRGVLKSNVNQAQTEVQLYSLNTTTKQLTINGENFTLAEESNSKLKFYAALPSIGNGPQYLIYIFE